MVCTKLNLTNLDDWKKGWQHKSERKNIGILITDHNVRETLKIVDRVYIVNEGAVFFEGNPNDAINNEK